ncbi:MAG: EAL domain-containing protein [Calditerrivibrio sp.]|nr:EAL domain-containing protein [Calditerrivibrio sp.]
MISYYKFRDIVSSIEVFDQLYLKEKVNHVALMEQKLGVAFRKYKGAEFEGDNFSGVFNYFYEYKYKKGCQACHGAVDEGAIAGYYLVSVSLVDVVGDAKKLVLIFSVLLSPLPIGGALLVSYLVGKKVGILHRSITSNLQHINTIQDLSKIEEVSKHTVFSDLNEIFEELNNFLRKAKSTAVDRHILEFELKILEKFLITSDVIKDWRKYVLSLVGEINKVVDVQVVFSLFRTNENEFSLEFFWTNQPSVELKNYIERLIEVKCIDFYKNYCDFNSITVHHSILPSDRCEIFNPELLRFETKSIILEDPKIGGIVGVGVNTRDSEDKVKSLVIEGILTTLLNVIGSVKAIAKYNKELEYYSTRDHITDLFNQRVFWEMLNYETARASRAGYSFAVVIIDLDNFKFLNDNFGHDVGDKFLFSISGIIKKNVRLGDIVARYSGDEFTILMSNVQADAVYISVKRILKSIEKFSFEYNDKRLSITASAGFALYPAHGDNAKDLFAFADTMLFKAKAEGKNNVLMPTKEDIEFVEKVISEKSYQIIRAIEENRIIPYFQPIMDIKTEEISMYEVLCRIEMGGKMYSAYEFIEIAERTGTIIKIDYLMLENAFNIVKHSLDTILFINLSPKSLILSEFIPNIIQITRKHGINPERVVFELTERETVKNLSILEKFVANLRAEGYKFAIDDFGSGYSSYDYIKRFPVDFVKIDGEFIKNMVTNSKDLAIVRSLLVLTEEFGIKTVAEFIENTETFQKAKEIGIDYAQGYYIGKPEPFLYRRQKN